MMMADRVFCGHGRGRGANPLAHVLQAIDEPLDLMEYNSWNVVLPEGQFLTEVGNTQFEDVLRQVSPDGIPEWRVIASGPPRLLDQLTRKASLLASSAVLGLHVNLWGW